MVGVSCGSSDSQDGGTDTGEDVSDIEIQEAADAALKSCDLSDTVVDPEVDVFGAWWVEISPQTGETENGYVMYYSQNNNALEGFFVDQNGGTHYFTGMVSGHEIHWDFSQGGALKITVEGESADGGEITGDYCDCRDGSQGTMQFRYTGNLAQD